MGLSSAEFTSASGTTMIDRLLAGSQWSDGTPSVTSVSYYIAGTNGSELMIEEGITANTFPEEVTAFLQAFAMFEAVCNIDFVEVGDQASANIVLGAVSDIDANGNLGYAYYPYAPGLSTVVINYEGYATADFSSLQVGGYDYITFIHELGHAVGLKHPHKNEGGAFLPFPGVTPDDSADLGTANLNQGIYTMMSYNDGNALDPSPSPTYGWEGTPMAFDIAALQYLYGANMTYHTGDDVYVLPAANEDGTYYLCVWDAAGTDTLKAGGSIDCTIDLRAATLNAGVGGGGRLSSHDGIHGGVTIANGVTIENATGGGGDDNITGNTAANVIRGNNGNDILKGSGGDDRIIGGNGIDTIRGDHGSDTLSGGAGRDKFLYTKTNQSVGVNRDFITDFEDGFDRIVLRTIDADTNTGGINEAFDFIGDADFNNIAGELRAYVNGAGSATIILGDTDGNGKADFRIDLTGAHTLTIADFIL